MPNLFTVPAGVPVADASAVHILGVVTGDDRARAVVFVPTRRAAVSMRAAFARALGGEASLLPRILPLADIDEALLTLLGADALSVLESIPPAMQEWQQRYFLAAQVRGFLCQRHGAVTLDYPLALAEDLVTLEDQCARAGVLLTPQKLRGLVSGSMATHWEQSLEFLNILTEHWPALERELGQTTRARREVLLVGALAAEWRKKPPAYHVFAVGSTASQESTAALLEVIATFPSGAVILPAVDPAISELEWESVASGHPLFHLKQFMGRFPVAASALHPLGQSARSVWSDALAATDKIPAWRGEALAPYAHIHLIPCQHAESEARVISLLMREALEMSDKRTALVTPDEGLMVRVAAQMKRYGITIDRLNRGTLAQGEEGSLWTNLTAALGEPERLIHLRSLLHHPLVSVDTQLLSMLEPYWYGVNSRRAGQMPKLPEIIRMHSDYPLVESLVRDIAKLARTEHKPSEWVVQCRRILDPLMQGNASDTLDELLDSVADADIFGAISVQEFISLLNDRLAEPMRHGGVSAHPQLVMLTPVEARLEHFDRVILGSMTENIWPGIFPPNAWLNLASQAALGLPPPTHQVSLLAHDMLMLGSSAEVFLTWPARDQGSPTTRSRFIERLVTLLAMHGISEESITAQEYVQWADALFSTESFEPSLPPEPRPTRSVRPTKLPITALDTLFSDPFAVYARHVLGLKKIDEIDADPQASDFGSLAHKAIHALTLHWNSLARAANEEELSTIADHALRDFSDRPSTALFWRTRLLRALSYVNKTEEDRRQSPHFTAQPEVMIEGELAGITLHGRIDRIEQSPQGAVIADYKTGETPTEKKIKEGHDTQLLAYALLATDVAAVEYWQLPHAKKEGEVTRVEFQEMIENDLPQKLKAALTLMLDEHTPFLANPTRIHDYDGISRYDEWVS